MYVKPEVPTAVRIADPKAIRPSFLNYYLWQTKTAARNGRTTCLYWAGIRKGLGPSRTSGTTEGAWLLQWEVPSTGLARYS